MMQTTLNIDRDKIRAYRDRLMSLGDPFAIHCNLNRTIDYIAINVRNNGKNDFYDTLHSNLYPIKVIYDIVPDLMEPYAYGMAERMESNTYKTQRREFIEENGLKNNFMKYLRERGITEEEYYFEFSARCLKQEFIIEAQLIDKRPKFVSSMVDTIEHMRDFNSVHLPAVQMVTSDNVYTLV
jgi:hypothetical protein